MDTLVHGWGQSFGAAVAEWGDFYTYVGTVAATLLGLLFVAVSLRLNIFHRREVADVRDFALLTFANFFFLVLIALLFLVPGQNRVGLALPLALMGVLGLAGFVWLAREFVSLNQTMPWWQWAYSGVSLATYGGLIVVAVALLAGRTRALFWLVGVDAALLTMSSVNAWMLLSHARAEDEGQSG